MNTLHERASLFETFVTITSRCSQGLFVLLSDGYPTLASLLQPVLFRRARANPTSNVSRECSTSQRLTGMTLRDSALVMDISQDPGVSPRLRHCRWLFTLGQGWGGAPKDHGDEITSKHMPRSQSEMLRKQEPNDKAVWYVQNPRSTRISLIWAGSRDTGRSREVDPA